MVMHNWLVALLLKIPVVPIHCSLLHNISLGSFVKGLNFLFDNLSATLVLSIVPLSTKRSIGHGAKHVSKHLNPRNDA